MISLVPTFRTNRRYVSKNLHLLKSPRKNTTSSSDRFPLKLTGETNTYSLAGAQQGMTQGLGMNRKGVPLKETTEAGLSRGHATSHSRLSNQQVKQLEEHIPIG